MGKESGQAQSLRAIRCSHNGIMLTNVYQSRRVPVDLAKTLEIGKNRRSRLTSEDRNMLTSMLNGYPDKQRERAA